MKFVYSLNYPTICRQGSFPCTCARNRYFGTATLVGCDSCDIFLMPSNKPIDP